MMRSTSAARVSRSCALVLAAALTGLLGTGCSKQARKARAIERADRYYDAGDYNKAEIEYKKVLRLEYANSHAVQRLGLIYDSQGRLARAAAMLFAARSMDTNNLAVRLRCGYILAAARKAKEARDEALFILDREPGHPEAPLLLVETLTGPDEIAAIRDRLETYRQRAGETAAYHLAIGNLSMRQRNTQAAEASFKRALVLDPKSSAAHTALGNLLWLQHDLKQAEAHYKAAAELAPARSSRRLRFVDFKLQTGAVEEAKELLREIVTKTPDYLPALHRSAQIALGERRFDECDAALRRILTRESSDFDALLLRARMRLAEEKRTEAVAEFTRLATQYPRVPMVHYNLALAHIANRDVTKAITSLNEAVRLEPGYADAVLLLSEINLRKGDAAAAIAALRQLIEKQPNNIQAHLTMAKAHLARQMPDEALRVYRNLASLTPTNPQPHFLIGRVLQAQGKLAEARQAFEKAATFAPDDLVVLERLVGLDIAERQYDSALKRLEKPIQKDSKAFGPQLLLARVNLAQGMTNQAEMILKKVIEQEPGARAAYLILAQIALTTNRREQALEQLDALLAKNPKDLPALMQVAAIQESSGNHTAARDAYEKILTLNTNVPIVLNNLAYLYAQRLGQLDRAYELARRARNLSPTDPSVADTLGWILHLRGEDSQALQLLQESAQKLGANPEIQYHLGMTHYRLGEEDMARLALQTAVESKAEFTGKSEAAQRLGILNLNTQNPGPQDIPMLEKTLSERPGDVVAASRLAAIHEHRGAIDKAVGVYQQALKGGPNSAVVEVKLAQLYANRLRDSKNALEHARKAAKLAPDDPYIAHLLGRIALQAGDRQWALRLLQNSARQRPNQAEVLYDLGLAYYAMGDVGQAESNLKIALQADSNFTQAEAAKQLLWLIGLANNPAQAGRAAAEIDKVLKSEPGSVPALMAAGAVHEARGNKPAAKQAYEAALTANPNFAPAIRQLAMLYAESTADSNKAYDMAAKAREAFPQDAALSKTLAVLAYRRGEYAKSAQLLKESVRKLTSDADVLYYLGLAHYQLNEKVDSRQALQKALAMNPSSPLAAEATNVLAKLK